MKTHERFFTENGYCRLVEDQYPFKSFTIDELYEMFKERMMAELLVDHPDLRSYGLLVELVTQGKPVPRTMKSQE